MNTYDLVGIGFGPSNMAIAIALQELGELSATKSVSSFFIEQKEKFAWHPNMLLQDADMQISFLKDLATPRNPRSKFTFLNYVHQSGRFADFVNLNTFMPSRVEFNQYLSWIAEHFINQTAYGERVIDIRPRWHEGCVEHLCVLSQNTQGVTTERLARNICVAVGGAPTIPEPFKDVYSDPRVFHTSEYLSRIKAHQHAQRIAIVGSGQSAAEVFNDLISNSDKEVDLIARGYALKPADCTPYVNHVFDHEMVDHFYNLDEQAKGHLFKEFFHTNYSCVDVDLIESIYRKMYEHKLLGEPKHAVRFMHDVQDCRCTSNGIELDFAVGNNGHAISRQYDVVILATGYHHQNFQTILKPISEYLVGWEVDRHYRLKTAEVFKPSIFTIGSNEASHGLSDTLLSLSAVRGGEIAQLLSVVNSKKNLEQV